VKKNYFNYLIKILIIYYNYKMDLYGSGASIAQFNAQTAEARSLNQATNDFNNSLAEQLDEAKIEVDQDKSGKVQKDILSLTTAGGKVVSKAEIGKNAKKALGGIKEVKTSLAERMAKEVGEERAGISTAEQLREAASRLTGTADEVRAEEFARGADIEAITAETGPLTTRSGAIVGVPTQQGLEEAHASAPQELYTAEQTVDESTEAAETARATGDIETAAKTAEKTGVEIGADVAKGVIKTGGKAVLAGAGGAIDVYQDIDRIAKGGLNKDAFGSNNWERVGNVLNVVGSGLEVAGVLTAWTGIGGLSLEAAGAGLGLLGAGLETYGDLEVEDTKEETVTKDITSQRRGEVAAAQVETATGRTE
jgi:hypothetical protein